MISDDNGVNETRVVVVSGDGGDYKVPLQLLRDTNREENGRKKEKIYKTRGRKKKIDEKMKETRREKKGK